jgi:hypothetical protein
MLIVKNTTATGAAADKSFAVVLVKNGDRYGRDFCLVNRPGEKLSDGRTLVEFWDLDYTHSPVAPGSQVYGQFVSRYFLATLLEDGGRRGVGLNLDGGIPAWSVDGPAMAEVSGWLLGVQDREWLEARTGVSA